MTVKEPKQLVIDASVARASGDKTATDPRAKSCRECLETVVAEGHFLVMSPRLKKEWDDHQSDFARRWRVGRAQKGKIAFVEDDHFPDMQVSLQQHCVLSDWLQIEKDLLLVEAALATDYRVISRDDIVRQLFRAACDHTSELKAVVWVDPTVASEKCAVWLREGAPDESHRTLGYRPTAD